jgi:hypothetical protein
MNTSALFSQKVAEIDEARSNDTGEILLENF